MLTGVLDDRPTVISVVGVDGVHLVRGLQAVAGGSLVDPGEDEATGRVAEVTPSCRRARKTFRRTMWIERAGVPLRVAMALLTSSRVISRRLSTPSASHPLRIGSRTCQQRTMLRWVRCGRCAPICPLRARSRGERSTSTEHNQSERPQSRRGRPAVSGPHGDQLALSQRNVAATIAHDPQPTTQITGRAWPAARPRQPRDTAPCPLRTRE